MNNKKHLKFLCLITFLVFSLASQGQNNNKEKITGTWFFYKLALMSHDINDSLQLLKETEGLVIIFEPGGKCRSRRNRTPGMYTYEGKYFLSDDGKKITQNNEEAEILSLTDTELVLKFYDAVILYFEKASPVQEKDPG